MAPDRHVANRVIILVSASYRSTDVQVVKEIVSNEGIGLISVGLDGSVGAMKPLSGYDVTQIRELNGIREKVQSGGQLMSMKTFRAAYFYSYDENTRWSFVVASQNPN